MIDFMRSYWWALLILAVLLGWGLLKLVRRVKWPKESTEKRPKDIGLEPLKSNLSWDGSDAAARAVSLEAVYDYVLHYCERTTAWYQGRRRPKRGWGLFLRTGALVLTALAGGVPLLADFGIKNVPAAVSTIFIAMAGIFVSMDVLQGHTSGWVRYMLAQQKVERLRDAFQIDWNSLKATNADDKAMLERARTMLLAVGKVIDDETKEWATEFQNAIKELDRVRKEAAETEHSGAIEVTVSNPQVVEGWTLEVDGAERGRTSGKTLAVTEVLVGIRKLRAYGDDANGKRFAGEGTVDVQGGATVPKQLELT